MSLPLGIAVIVLADLALLGVLVFVMSRAKLLTPHASRSHAHLHAPRAASARFHRAGPARAAATRSSVRV
jgi:hypothetical protein